MIEGNMVIAPTDLDHPLLCGEEVRKSTETSSFSRVKTHQAQTRRLAQETDDIARA